MCKYSYRLFSFLSLVFFSCRNDHTTLFTELDKTSTGINFQNTFFDDGPLNVANYIYFYNGGGVAIGDINNDGLQDILFTGNMVKNRLFLNKGNFEFEDITTRSGIADKQGWCTGATMADINGDGKLDIYICRSADINPKMRANLLFINNGNLTFSEKGAEYGLADAGYSTQAAFLDYDKDGDLDCFIINHSIQKYTAGVQEKPELRKQHDPAYASKLFRNDNGHFTDVTDAAGITSNVLTFGLGIAVSDFNNDGWPDVSVSNDFNEPDYLFINNRNGTFTEQLSKSMDEVSLYSMGSDAADYNNDGLVDLLTLDMMPEDNKTIKMHSGAENYDKFQFLFTQGFYYQYSRNMLQKNNGDGTFSEVGQLSGVSNTDWSWSALFGDYDNDGNKDLFVTNGYVKDYTDMDFMRYSMDRLIRSMHKDTFDAVPEYIKKMPTNRIANYIYQNNGNETFTKKTKEWGLDQPGVSSGAAYADLDNDGDLDLVINNSNDYAGIYKNNATGILKNNFLRVHLAGNALNERGIGTKVKLYCKGQLYYQEESPVRGFQSSSDPILNFGIGKNTSIDSLLVIWPDDRFQKLNNIKPNQTLTLKLADASRKWVYDTIENANQSLLTQTTMPAVQHHENNFSDFTVQTLMPNFLSRQGPCIEVADINKDGLEDFFMGGAKDQVSQIFIQNANGMFTAKVEPAIQNDSKSEDVAAAFFDADNDGDKDLYVAAGGFEFSENDEAFQDRLYINDGKGNFTRKGDALPQMLASKGCVKATDIDGDGDMDLFVGGRVVPGKYPTAPQSYVLINDGKGKFTDATLDKCPALQHIGMVTDALWIDLNNDQQPDLIVVGEWMPIKVFINKKGKLTDESSAYIPFASTGWWNRIYANDMDGDGDLDIIVGNYGLNTQFHVNEKQPMTIYYKDLDGNGTIDPILCYYIDGVSYPYNSRDDLAEQLPGIKKKFLEYAPYSVATINDLFTPEQLKGAAILKAETMQTVYLQNQGSKGFVLHALPIEAQYSPVYGIAAADVNGDGKKDILLTGNNTWTRIKFGRYNANHGVLLLGDGKVGFTYAPQAKSGLNIRGNVRCLQLIKTGKSQSIIAGVNDGNAVMLKIQAQTK
ncbi:MAG TPA: VCBS repeat-containing protein [Chitinophagaceae bacterium]|nr:VCBS repeat-containing protein [Chitinophagaceae bacterium]